jgi:predicted MFS family arabinose efflux permease
MPALAGLLLALMSVGSATGALAYGGRVWNAPLVRQFSAMLMLMGGGTAVLGAVADPWVFAVFSVLAGFAMAPALIIQSMLVARIARPIHSTEAFTWSSMALLAGVSAGIALAGSILDHSPPSTVFVTAGIVSTSAAAISAMALRIR